MNKRGQFYILGAIMIVVVITGITSMSTYSTTKVKPRSLESMGKELKEEGFRIIDYSVYNKGPPNNKIPYDKLNDFTLDYSDYFLKKTDNSNVIMIYGNKSNLFATQYETPSIGVIRASLGAPSPTWTITNIILNRSVLATPLTPSPDPVVVNLLGNEYNFDINENEMFYFVMAQEKEGERYIEKDP
jgi:hypothetical protein